MIKKVLATGAAGAVSWTRQQSQRPTLLVLTPRYPPGQQNRGIFRCCRAAQYRYHLPWPNTHPAQAVGFSTFSIEFSL
jgi:hypothetical protein